MFEAPRRYKRNNRPKSLRRLNGINIRLTIIRGRAQKKKEASLMLVLCAKARKPKYAPKRKIKARNK